MMFKILLPCATNMIDDFTKPTPLQLQRDMCTVDCRTGLITFSNGDVLTVDQLLKFLDVARIVHTATIPMHVETKLGTLLEFSCDTGSRFVTIADRQCDPEFTFGRWAEHVAFIFGRKEYF